MPASSRIKPRPEHWALYKQQPFRYATLEPADKRERLGYIALGMLLVTVLGPFIPSRRPNHHFPASWDEYHSGLVVSAILAVLLGVGAYQEYIAKPVRNQRKAYRLVGRFVVRGKQQVFSSAWLELAPDATHRVGIDPALFDRFQVGDTVEVAYSATGELLSVRKIVLPAATV